MFDVKIDFDNLERSIIRCIWETQQYTLFVGKLVILVSNAAKENQVKLKFQTNIEKTSDHLRFSPWYASYSIC